MFLDLFIILQARSYHLMFSFYQPSREGNPKKTQFCSQGTISWHDLDRYAQHTITTMWAAMGQRVQRQEGDIGAVLPSGQVSGGLP